MLYPAELQSLVITKDLLLHYKGFRRIFKGQFIMNTYTYTFSTLKIQYSKEFQLLPSLSVGGNDKFPQTYAEATEKVNFPILMCMIIQFHLLQRMLMRLELARLLLSLLVTL